MRGQPLRREVKPIVIEIEHVGIPCAAELHEADAELIEYPALLIDVTGNLVGKPGQCPHQRAIAMAVGR